MVFLSCQHKLHSERGAAAVEFALLLPVLTLIIIGMMVFGVTLNRYLIITHAAREAVRWAALRSEIGSVDDPPEANTINGRANWAATGIALTDPDIVVTGVTTPATDSDQGNPVTVTITYNNSDVSDIFFGFNILLPNPISGSATQRVE